MHFGVGKMTQFEGDPCVCTVIDTHIDHDIVKNTRDVIRGESA